MSLVICSNQSSDATSVARDQSIFKPYSFRNALSSTLKLPKNCQVALESVKYNLDGSVSLSGDSYIMFVYFGEDPIDDGTDEPLNYSTAFPIRVPLIDEDKKGVTELSFEDLTRNIQSQLNKYIYHPNLRDTVSGSIIRDATTNELAGIQIDVDEFTTVANAVPTNASEFGNHQFLEAGAEAGWSYNFEEGFLVAEPGSNDNIEPVAILTDSPISLHGGKLIVNFEGIDPAEGSDWRVGLSRYTNPYQPDSTGLTHNNHGKFAPDYFSVADGYDEGPTPGNIQGGFFADFCVSKVGETLMFSHTALDSQSDAGPNQIKWLDIVYGNDGIPADYNISTNASAFAKVEFECRGEKIKVSMLDQDDNASILYEYAEGLDSNAIAKPINQACWTMYPVLSLSRNSTGSLIVENFTPCSNISTHNILDEHNSWYQSQYRNSNGDSAAQAIETRPWNDESESDKDQWLIQEGTNASGVINLPLKLLVSPSELYQGYDAGANVGALLGISTAEKDFGFIADPTTTRRLLSSVQPKLLSAKTMFVRLENFTTNSTNAHQGNQSKIIAHLPRFDGQVETGRIFHQPNNLIYLDLNNSEELKINSFDISFCYSNEQYATALTGQSVVVLHFKEKGS